MIWIQFGEHHYNMSEIQCVQMIRGGITVVLRGHTIYNIHMFGRNLTTEQWEHFLTMEKLCQVKAYYEKEEKK